MTDAQRVFPNEVCFSTKPCQVLADMNSWVEPEYREVVDRYPYCDGIRDISVCQSGHWTDAENLIADVAAGKRSWIGIGWLPFITTFVNAARNKGMTALAYADWIYDRCKELNTKVGYRAAWIEAYGEIGNSVTWPRGQTFTKRQAMEYFRHWFTTGRTNTEHWGRPVDASTMSYFAHAKHRDANLRNLPVYYSEGALFGVHEAYRLGFPLVAYEGGCGSPDSIQTGVAFTRGGAKMFNAWWGLDLSPWTYGIMGEVAEASNAGSRIRGMTPEHMFRIWVTAYMAGCNTLLHEVGYTFFYTRLSDNTPMLSDYGYQAMRFYRLKREILADRGEPVVPFAIMLEEEHGYRGNSTREYTEDGKLTFTYDYKNAAERLCLWSGRITELSRGDWQVQRLVASIFAQPKTTKGLAEQQWPDTSGDVYDPTLTAERLMVGDVDAREHDRFLRDSRWSDGFDVVIEDADEKVLSTYYKAVILAGDIRTDNGLWARLEKFVEQGGSVVLTLEQLNDETRRSLGMEKTGTTTVQVESMIAEDVESGVHEELILNSVKLPTNASVWSKDAKTSAPLIVGVAKGRGHVYVVLCTDGMDKTASKTSAVMTRLIDALYGKHVGVTICGPACQMLINRRNDDTLVTLINHTATPWQGSVRVDRRLYPKIDQVRDMFSELAYPATNVFSDAGSVRVQTTIPAYDVRVLAFGPVRETPAYRGYRTTQSGMTDDDRAFIESIRAKGADVVLGPASVLKKK